jgi:GT2 family glycosyltransferase
MVFSETSISFMNKVNNYSYAVISPVKDEASYIEATICSMLEQTVRPAVWVIINDGSTDATQSILEKYVQENSWIKLVNRQDDAGIRKRGKGVIEAFYAGYKTLTDSYDFIVKLDGDVTFGPDYFESLFSKFVDDPLLGIAGGGLYERPDGHTWRLFTVKDHVRGCTKVYRRECFEAIGGLVASMGWDGLDEWKALAKGWRVRSFLDLKIYHYRFTGAATGYLKSCIEQGYGAYRMGYHPLFMIVRGLRRVTDRPYVIGGLAMIGAYLMAWWQKKEILTDPSVVKYIHQSQMKILADMIFRKQVNGG